MKTTVINSTTTPRVLEVVTKTILPTGVKLLKDKNGNIVTLLTPYSDTLPLNSKAPV